MCSATRQITFQSTVQLKNFWTGARLSTIKKGEETTCDHPQIYTSVNAYEDGMPWTIVSPFNEIEDANKPISCGQNVSFVSTYTNYYLTVLSKKEVPVMKPTIGYNGPASDWKVICEKNDTWKQFEQIQLYNEKHKCYLLGTFDHAVDDDIKKFNATCGNNIQYSFWSVSNGVFFDVEDM